MKSEEDFIELGEWQLNAFKQKDKYKQALEEIREILNKECGVISNAKVVGIINEVLNEEE